MDRFALICLEDVLFVILAHQGASVAQKDKRRLLEAQKLPPLPIARPVELEVAFHFNPGSFKL